MAAAAVLSLTSWVQVQAAAPLVSEVVPANGATGVSVNTTVVFKFDQAMATAIPVMASMPGIFVGNIEWTPAGVAFTYQWSGDGKSLTCTPTDSLPSNATISWRLNPVGTLFAIMNTTGTALPTATGSFQTGEGGGCDPDGVPDDWGSYSVFKQGRYVQTLAGAPTPYPETPFAFLASVQAPPAGPSVTEASVTLPGGTQKMLPGMPFNAGFLFLDAPATEAALDQAYPAGTYTLRFTQQGQAQRVIPMTMPAGHPPVPHFTNYEQARQIDVSQPFVLTWDPYSGAGPNDVQVLIISDSSGETVFMAPDFCVPRPLPVSDTSVVIPADTLQDNRTYTASLGFLQRFYVSTETVANMNGIGMVSRSTEMTLRTGSGGEAEPAEFTGYRLLPNGNPELTLAGTPDASYAIQRTSSLEVEATDWSEVGTATMSGDGTAVFEDTTPGKVLPLFYRAVAQ